MAPLQQQLVALLGRDGLKAKHLLPPLKLAHALLLALRGAQAAQAAPAAAAFAGAVAALQQKQPEAARSLTGQCRKLEALAQQVQSNAPLPGGVKKAHKKARLQT